MSLPPRVAAIIDEIGAAHKVTRAEILGRSTTQRIYAARREAMRAVRALTMPSGGCPSYPQIGRWFGRHHTTVMFACEDPELPLGIAA